MNGAAVQVYSLAKDGKTRLSAHFQVKEFACHDGSDTVFVSPQLVEVLETLRMHFGRAVYVNSGYRTETHNKAQGGAAYSRHKYGMAADISVRGVTPQEVADRAAELMGQRGGIGVYASFTHIDVREKKSRWKG